MNQKENCSMKLFMRLHDRSYDIILKRGSLDRLHHFTDLVHRRVMVVTDAGVPTGYAARLLAQCTAGTVFAAPRGERCKTLEVYGELLRAMRAAGLGREDVVVALGGGSVADLAGFAASTYLGGVAFVNCPTTTMGQLDPCLSAGPSLDLDRELGAVCVRRQPDLVILDPDLADTLDARDWNTGMAEALRIALPCCPDLMALLEAGEWHRDIEDILWQTLNAKKNLLEEQSPCSALQFGLPLARALESEKGLYGRRTSGLIYGECLALGFLPLIEDKALARRARAVCRALDLPCRVAYSRDKMLARLRMTPEVSEGHMPLIRVTGPGCWRVDTLDLTRPDIDALAQLGQEGAEG